MKTFYLLLGVLLVPTGITVFMLDRYLARKKKEFEERGIVPMNLSWPVFGPHPWIGIAFVIMGVAFLIYALFL